VGLVTLGDLWSWADVLAKLSFSSSEELEDRIFYAGWWIELATCLSGELTPNEGGE
jgi:hypothetical protein